MSQSETQEGKVWEKIVGISRDIDTHNAILFQKLFRHCSTNYNDFLTRKSALRPKKLDIISGYEGPLDRLALKQEFAIYHLAALLQAKKVSQTTPDFLLPEHHVAEYAYTLLKNNIEIREIIDQVMDGLDEDAKRLPFKLHMDIRRSVEDYRRLPRPEELEGFNVDIEKFSLTRVAIRNAAILNNVREKLSKRYIETAIFPEGKNQAQRCQEIIAAKKIPGNVIDVKKAIDFASDLNAANERLKRTLIVALDCIECAEIAVNGRSPERIVLYREDLAGVLIPKKHDADKATLKDCASICKEFAQINDIRAHNQRTNLLVRTTIQTALKESDKFGVIGKKLLQAGKATSSSLQPLKKGMDAIKADEKLVSTWMTERRGIYLQTNRGDVEQIQIGSKYIKGELLSQNEDLLWKTKEVGKIHLKESRSQMCSRVDALIKRNALLKAER